MKILVWTIAPVFWPLFSNKEEEEQWKKDNDVKLIEMDIVQEEKELLLKDLCARLRYGVKFSWEDKIFTLLGVVGYTVYTKETHQYFLLEDCKPYLRPMSSMTEEESKEFALLQTDFYVDGFLYPIAAISMVNWLNEHHFDYRGLIEKGLALEAPEGMYK